MSKTQNKFTDRLPIADAVRVIALSVLLLSGTACVSTGDKKEAAKPTQVAPVARNNCGPGAGAAPAAGQPAADQAAGDSSQPVDGEQAAATGEGAAATGPAVNNCLPKGVIEIVENFPADQEVKAEFNQAVSQLEGENYAEAIRLLKGVTGKTGKFSAPFINLGIAYARSGELVLAEETLNKALAINNFHPVANNELGMVYRRTGRYPEARKLYESLLSWYPDFLPARKNLGVLCDIYLQDLECALDQYEEYLKGVPGDEKVTIWVADVKSRM